MLATLQYPACWYSRLQPSSGRPQWPGAHSRHWGPPAPGWQWHCPLWGWHSEPSAAGPQAHGRQPPQLWNPKYPSCGTDGPHCRLPPGPAQPQAPPSAAALPGTGHRAAPSRLACTHSARCGGRRSLSRMGSSRTLQRGCHSKSPEPLALPRRPLLHPGGPHHGLPPSPPAGPQGPQRSTSAYGCSCRAPGRCRRSRGRSSRSGARRCGAGSCGRHQSGGHSR